ncbi:unnamed protein product [Calypogeia fissa]
MSLYQPLHTNGYTSSLVQADFSDYEGRSLCVHELPVNMSVSEVGIRRHEKTSTTQRSSTVDQKAHGKRKHGQGDHDLMLQEIQLTPGKVLPNLEGRNSYS